MRIPFYVAWPAVLLLAATAVRSSRVPAPPAAGTGASAAPAAAQQEADATLQEAMQQFHLHTNEGNQKALPLFLKAAAQYRAIGLAVPQARCLLAAGLLCDRSGQPKPALEYDQEALSLFRKAGDADGEGTALLNSGTVYEETGDPKQAIRCYEQLSILAGKTGNKGEVATALAGIGEIRSEIGQTQQALAAYQQALLLLDQARDRGMKATILRYIGNVYYSNGAYRQALPYYRQVLAIVRGLGDRDGEGATLNNIGAVYVQSGEPQEALQYFRQALPLVQGAGDRRLEAYTLSNIGSAYKNIGQRQQALQYYLQELPVLHGLDDKNGEAVDLANIGDTYMDLEQPQEALRDYTLALDLAQGTDNKSMEAALQDSIGRACQLAGQPQQALQYYGQALDLDRSIQDRGSEAGILDDTGGVYEEVGQPEQALECYREALDLSEKTGNEGVEASVLTGIGQLYDNLGQPQQALQDYQRALELARKRNERDLEGTALNNIGAIYHDLRQREQALYYYRQALDLWRQLYDGSKEAAALNNIGLICIDMGEPRQALQYLQQALALEQRLGTRSSQAATLCNEAQANEKLGQMAATGKLYEQALGVIDSIVGGISRDDLKRSVVETYQGTYQDYIGFLLHRAAPGDVALALETSERARSRALRDLLAGNTSQLPSAALTRSQVSNPSAVRAAETGAPASPSPTASPTAAPTASRTRAIWATSRPIWATARALAGVEQAVEDLPPLSTSAQAKPFPASEAAQSAVDGPVILYQGLADGLAIFVIHPSGQIRVARSTITSAGLAALIRQAREGMTGNETAAASAALRRLYAVLIQPVAPWILPGSSAALARTPTQTLTIVPYGILFQVPFAALTAPDGHYLVERAAIRTAPSLTVLRYTRQQAAALRNAPIHAALFGDPKLPAAAPSTVKDLPGAAVEVETVSRRLGSGSPLIGGEATEVAFRQQAPQATEIHLATHGYVNEEEPLLSAVILASSQGPQPPYQRDGFLTVAEVFRLKLHARLVTLSACDTGLGPTGADGVFGLQSAFLSAGAASLLSSLWEVDDAATRLLMEQFYQRLEQDPQHDRAKALREAQLALLSTGRYRAPGYWAAFELTGEGR